MTEPSPHKATLLRILLALALVSVLVGCGTSGSETSGSSATRAEFIEQANAICNEANEELRQGMVEIFGPGQEPTNETGIRYTQEIWVPNLRQQVRDLEALDWPPADRRNLETMMSQLTRATDRIEVDPALAIQGPFDKVTRELTAYGIGPCGSP